MMKAVLRLSRLLIIPVVVLMAVQNTSVAAAPNKAKAAIVLDSGHGEDYNYHTFYIDGHYFTEFEINWVITEHLYDILKNYKEIDLYLTKKDEYEHPDLKSRVITAAKIKKKTKLETYLISIHNNARSDGISDITNTGQHGCMVLASNQNYKPKVSEKIDPLAYNIIEELELLGLHVNYPDNGGILRRSSKNSKYPNGKPADYYGLIQHGIYQNIPTVIVEHAYMTDTDDVRKFLITDEGLYSLAVADAKAIVSFLGLKWDSSYEKMPS